MSATRWRQVSRLCAVLLALLTVTSACGGDASDAEHGYEDQLAALEPISLDAGEKLNVVATTNIVGDIVRQVGGDQIVLTTLMGPGIDPHSYVPTPADTAAIHDAHIVFANGAGLEADLAEMFESAGGDARQIYLSLGLELLLTEDTGGEASREHEQEGQDEGLDPHVWFDVKNVIHWVETIEEALSALDPTNADMYRANANAYVRELESLDNWVVEQLATIPENNRKLVTNHPAFVYFATRYGLEQVGAIYPISPSSEPSAQDIAALEDAIREYGVSAVFTESTVNPKLARQVAEDTGVNLVALYTGSLGGPGSGVESYVDLIRFDVNAIVGSLK